MSNLKWQLDYNDGLFLHLPLGHDISGSVFFKLKLKRYVADMQNGVVRFKESLTYLDYKRVIELCQHETVKQGIILCIRQALTDYINVREMHLDARSRLGVELKHRDEKLHERFYEYRYVVDNAMSRKLREKQMWDSFFMCAMRKSGNFSVPGSGKTASVLGMYAYMKKKDIMRRIVVICPKNAFGSWIDEFCICFADNEPLKCFNIHSSAYKSSRDRKRAIQLESGNCNLFLFNYEAVDTYSREIISLIDEKTLLVFDEVHKVKRIDGMYAQAAVEIAENAQYVVAMTGTPIPNAYTDIYNFLHILFPYEYHDFFNFSPALLRNPSPKDRVDINDKLQPFFVAPPKSSCKCQMLIQIFYYQ